MLRPLFLISPQLLEFIRQHPKDAIRIAELYGRECYCTDIKWEQATHEVDTFAGPPIFIAGDVSGYAVDFCVPAERPNSPDMVVIIGNGTQHLFIVHDFGDVQVIKLYLNVYVTGYDSTDWRTVYGQNMGYTARLNFTMRSVEHFKME